MCEKVSLKFLIGFQSSPAVVTPFLPYRRLILYIAMLAVALLAGHWNLEMQSRLHSLSAKVQQALRLTALASMENRESQQYESEAQIDEQNAEQLEGEASRYAYKTKVDKAYAARDRLRAQYFAKIAALEESEAEAMYAKANRDEQMRIAILANMTKDMEQEEELVTELRTGACSWHLVGRLCDLIGSTTKLKQEADSEYLKIHEEWHEASDIRHKEFMEELVANTMQHRASVYNKTATDLLRVADMWDRQATKDAARAFLDNITAEALHVEAENLEKHAEQSKKWEMSNDSVVQQLLQASERDHIAAEWDAAMAIFLASVALFFFALQAAPKSMYLLRSLFEWATVDQTEEVEFWAGISYVVQHLILFLMVIGLSGTYLIQIEKYHVQQRAVIVLWIAFLGSFLQSLFLHAVPHAMAEAPIDASDLKTIAKQFGRRMLALFGLFVLETLLSWVAIGHTLFDPGMIGFLSSWIFCWVALISVVLHVCVFEPRMTPLRDEHSTLLTADEESTTLSEVSPLREEETMLTGSSPTAALMHIDLGREGRQGYRTIDANSEHSVVSRSPYYVSLKDEILKLLLPFELLVVACMVAILHNCIPVLSHREASTQVIALICFCIFVMAVGIAMKKAEERHLNMKKIHHFELQTL